MLRYSFDIDEDNFEKLISLKEGYVSYMKYNTLIKLLLTELYPSDMANIIFSYTGIYLSVRVFIDCILVDCD